MEDDYIPKTTHLSHQARLFAETRDAQNFGLFWEQGTGKTKPVLDTAAYQYLKGNIDGLLVVAPNGVHLNWLSDEIPAHLPDRVFGVMRGHSWFPPGAGTLKHAKAIKDVINHPGFAVLVVPFESFNTDKCKKACWDFLRHRKTLMVADEGIMIKNASAKRTKAVVEAGRYAVMRRLLNGTPIAGEPWDVFPQLKFLKYDFWVPYELDGEDVFKSHFGRWQDVKDESGRLKYKMCVSHRRLDELQGIVKTITDRVLKDDVLDLPPKVYGKARFDLSKEQRDHYENLKEEFLTWLKSEGGCEACGGSGHLSVPMDNNESMEYQCDSCQGSGFKKAGLVTADLAITRMLRLQQITCGYLPTPEVEEEPVHMFKENPRLDRFIAGARLVPHGCIVWTRFQKDAELICEALKAEKKTVVRYDGTVKDADRALAKAAFQKEEAQFFVANPAAISMGITLLPGKTVVYYSSSFNLVHRLQSEDRSHRHGQTSSVSVQDIMANDTIDEAIVKALREKVNISQQITGDKVRSWI